MTHDYYIGQHITKWPLRSLSILILYNFMNVLNVHNTHEWIQMLPNESLFLIHIRHLISNKNEYNIFMFSVKAAMAVNL